MKFKIGDKVKVITKIHGEDQFGLVGIVHEFTNEMFLFPIRVQFKDHRNGYRENELAYANSVIIREKLGIK